MVMSLADGGFMRFCDIYLSVQNNLGESDYICGAGRNSTVNSCVFFKHGQDEPNPLTRINVGKVHFCTPVKALVFFFKLQLYISGVKVPWLW